jgi:hypothetical protein
MARTVSGSLFASHPRVKKVLLTPLPSRISRIRGIKAPDLRGRRSHSDWGIQPSRAVGWKYSSTSMVR